MGEIWLLFLLFGFLRLWSKFCHPLPAGIAARIHNTTKPAARTGSMRLHEAPSGSFSRPHHRRSGARNGTGAERDRTDRRRSQWLEVIQFALNFLMRICLLTRPQSPEERPHEVTRAESESRIPEKARTANLTMLAEIGSGSVSPKLPGLSKNPGRRPARSCGQF